MHVIRTEGEGDVFGDTLPNEIERPRALLRLRTQRLISNRLSESPGDRGKNALLSAANS